MYIRVNKETLKIQAISSSPLRQLPNTVVIYNPNIKTLNPEYIKVWEDYETGKIYACELTDEEKKQVDRQKFEKYRQYLKESLDRVTTEYIHYYYSDIKQKSDQADKEFCTTLIVNQLNLTTDEILQKVYHAVELLYSGQTTLTEISEQLGKDDNGNPIVLKYGDTEIPLSHLYEQLIKIAIRVAWVQQVKLKYKQYLNQIETANDYKDLPYVPSLKELIDPSAYRIDFAMRMEEPFYPPFPSKLLNS
jgi:hypothetical protein